jgi:hypothetical protein
MLETNNRWYNCIAGREDPPWHWRSHSVEILGGVHVVAVRVRDVLQCPWQQCGQTLLLDIAGEDGWVPGGGVGPGGPSWDLPRPWCTKTVANSVITECSLLLQLWSYKQFAIAGPRIDLKAYEDTLYHDEEDKATLRSHWASRGKCHCRCCGCNNLSVQMSKANDNVKKSYPWCLMQFDWMLVEEVRWQSYNAERATRKSSCRCAHATDGTGWHARSYWFWHLHLQCINPVLRQFGFQQLISRPLTFNRGCRDIYTSNMHFN